MLRQTDNRLGVVQADNCRVSAAARRAAYSRSRLHPSCLPTIRRIECRRTGVSRRSGRRGRWHQPQCDLKPALMGRHLGPRASAATTCLSVDDRTFSTTVSTVASTNVLNDGSGSRSYAPSSKCDGVNRVISLTAWGNLCEPYGIELKLITAHFATRALRATC
jgi:hypothetical protein